MHVPQRHGLGEEETLAQMRRERRRPTAAPMRAAVQECRTRRVGRRPSTMSLIVSPRRIVGHAVALLERGVAALQVVELTATTALAHVELLAQPLYLAAQLRRRLPAEQLAHDSLVEAVVGVEHEPPHGGQHAVAALGGQLRRVHEVRLEHPEEPELVAAVGEHQLLQRLVWAHPLVADRLLHAEPLKPRAKEAEVDDQRVRDEKVERAHVALRGWAWSGPSLARSARRAGGSFLRAAFPTL